MKIITGVLAFVLAFVLAAFAASNASAAVTLGSAVDHLSELSSACGDAGGCAAVHETLPGRVTRAPFRGVVVRWRVKGRGSFRVFVARYTGDDTVVRGAESKNGDESFPTTKVRTYGTRLAIEAGQYIGLRYVNADSRVVGLPDRAGFDLDSWRPAPAPGQPTLATFRDLPDELGFNADVEPDADRDGYGDETQDACPSDPRTQRRCGSPPGPPRPTPPGSEPDTTPPAFLSGPSITPRTVRARRGARLRFSLSEAARVVVTIQRSQSGRRVNGRCRKARRGRRCTRYRSFASIRRAATEGSNVIRIRSRIGGRALRAGRYRATVRATDDAGNRSGARRVRFRVR